jgi:hypothetical protein
MMSAINCNDVTVRRYHQGVLQIHLHGNSKSLKSTMKQTESVSQPRGRFLVSLTLVSLTKQTNEHLILYQNGEGTDMIVKLRLKMVF